MQIDEHKLDVICQKYGFKYHITNSHIIIKTIYANWKFDYTMKPYHLYHRPILLRDYRSAINTNDGYHDQKKCYNNISDLINYIHTHDNNLLTKKRHNNQKTKKK